MRIHLGHHFYGAGNLGDDFMLAGFLAAMRTLAPRATMSCCVPFALEQLQRRFPTIEWLPHEDRESERAIAVCDVWLGLGGSPFQSEQSRWFVDHLTAEAECCARLGKPMFFLGIGIQRAAELALPEVRHICAQARGIWTRDAASARLLAALPSPPRLVESAADLAHLFFRENPPPRAARGRLTLVANFDYGTWPGQSAVLAAAADLPLSECVWLAQETRELPGAERALHASLSPAEQSRWKLIVLDDASAPALASVFSRWPSGEWLVTARYHAALAGAWAGSKVVVLTTNEKLHGVAHELGCPSLSPVVTDSRKIKNALQSAVPLVPPVHQAERAFAACAAFVSAAGSRSIVAPRR